MDKDQTTTPGTTRPTLYNKCVGSLTSPANQYNEDAGDGVYGLSSLSEKTRISNHLQMSLQRQHILLSYFKTLSVGPVWDLLIIGPSLNVQSDSIGTFSTDDENVNVTDWKLGIQISMLPRTPNQALLIVHISFRTPFAILL